MKKHLSIWVLLSALFSTSLLASRVKPRDVHYILLQSTRRLAQVADRSHSKREFLQQLRHEHRITLNSPELYRLTAQKQAEVIQGMQTTWDKLAHLKNINIIRLALHHQNEQAQTASFLFSDKWSSNCRNTTSDVKIFCYIFSPIMMILDAVTMVTETLVMSLYNGTMSGIYSNHNPYGNGGGSAYQQQGNASYSMPELHENIPAEEPAPAQEGGTPEQVNSIAEQF